MFVFAFVCAFAGMCVGVLLGPQLKTTPPGRMIVSMANKVPFTKSIGETDKDSPIEMYDYPTIKWRAKPLADPPDAIGQLWTKFEQKTGKMDYRLTLFKAQSRTQCQVQMLDDNGFKIGQFEVTDFHPVPGAADIIESKDSCTCTEEDYKRMGDYSIN
jgi:hypothetical protein